jgi:hypothetical protein
MMSNFSDPMAALLNGMAAEWRLLAMDVAELADFASNVPTLNDTMMVKLQAFDAMLQNVEAQARLLQALAQDCASADLTILLDDHPLPGVRERLKASLGLAATAPDEAGGALQLFMVDP